MNYPYAIQKKKSGVCPIFLLILHFSPSIHPMTIFVFPMSIAKIISSVLPFLIITIAIYSSTVTMLFFHPFQTLRNEILRKRQIWVSVYPGQAFVYTGFTLVSARPTPVTMIAATTASTTPLKATTPSITSKTASPATPIAWA